MEKILWKISCMEREDRMETGDPGIRIRDISRGVSRMVRIEDSGSIGMIIGMIDLSQGFEMEDSEDIGRKI